MRDLNIHITMRVNDDVTDDEIAGFLATLQAAAEEPVSGYDASGNEETFSAKDVQVRLVP